MRYSTIGLYILLSIAKTMHKSIKEKILSTITAHPCLVTLGIGIAITFVIGTTIEMVDHQTFAQVIAQHNHAHIDST